MKANQLKAVSERVFAILETYRREGWDALRAEVRKLEDDLPIGYMEGWLGSFYKFYNDVDSVEGQNVAYKELCGFYAGLQAALWAMEGDEYKILD